MPVAPHPNRLRTPIFPLPDELCDHHHHHHHHCYHTDDHSREAPPHATVELTTIGVRCTITTELGNRLFHPLRLNALVFPSTISLYRITSTKQVSQLVQPSSFAPAIKRAPLISEPTFIYPNTFLRPTQGIQFTRSDILVFSLQSPIPVRDTRTVF